MRCFVSLSQSPFWTSQKGKIGVSMVSFQDTFGPDEISFSMFVKPAQSGVSL
ncbi:hypothetical protein EXN66_Car002460 [Channa argus]|uniref:Uncharacterized protein n=1 Tax=Channa argus TaxID=215402 RepID=A0A6G1P9S0_CHAAH|nr:hypothetical protein EXN66_Car002460 [Channa argus]